MINTRNVCKIIDIFALGQDIAIGSNTDKSFVPIATKLSSSTYGYTTAQTTQAACPTAPTHLNRNNIDAVDRPKKTTIGVM